jgi:hypothetical protein
MTNNLNIDLHPWKISETIKIFLITQVSVTLLYLFTGLAFDIDFGSSYFNLGFVSISSVVLLLAVVYSVRNKYKLPIKHSLNLYISNPFILLLYMLVGISVAIMFEMLIPEFSTSHSFISQFVTTKSTFVIAAFGAIFIAPICEEIYWRGFVFPAVEKRFSRLNTILIVSSFATLVHLSGLWGVWGSLLMVFLGSVVLTVLRCVTGSTLSCIITHTVYNVTIIAIPIVKNIFK